MGFIGMNLIVYISYTVPECETSDGLGLGNIHQSSELSVFFRSSDLIELYGISARHEIRGFKRGITDITCEERNDITV